MWRLKTRDFCAPFRKSLPTLKAFALDVLDR